MSVTFEHFWSQVQIAETGCWEWCGGHTSAGYGITKHCYTHRLSWEMLKGPIPPGQCVCHSCDNPTCVRPDHLFLGTHKENMEDMTRKGRHTPITGMFPGEKNHQSKLTDEQVRAIRSEPMPLAYGRQAALASQYNVSLVTINRILRGLSWKHIKCGEYRCLKRMDHFSELPGNSQLRSWYRYHPRHPRTLEILAQYHPQKAA